MKPKLAYIGVKYYPSKGGTSRVVENLTRKLKDHYDITVYCYRNRMAKGYIPGVHVVSLPSLPFGSFGVFVYYILCTAHALLYGKYDLVHVHKIDAAFVIPILSKKFRVVATSHESPYLRDKWNWLGKKYFLLCEKIFIRSSATLTSISRPLTDYYMSKYQKKVWFIPNGIEITEKMDMKGASVILQKYDIHKGYVMFAARRIMGTKGIHTLLEALEYIHYKGDVVIAGDASHAPQLIKKLTLKHAELNLKFIGYVDHLGVLLALVRQAELFIFPSETEGMSIMLLEVASTGTPLICSDIPENTQIFTGDEVTYFRNKDATDLGNKITEALDDMKALNKKADNAVRKIKKVYLWDRIVTEYKVLYGSVLNN
ncbi:MAG TPA: glycosyltransferase [Bacteroidetes bacterium]|nr:glycosyltransferase [Bacteroidota bacterium]